MSTDIQWAPVPEVKLTPCRVTINMVGAKVGETVNVNLDAPGMDDLVYAGYLVPLEARPLPPHLAGILASDAAEAVQEPPGADETLDAAPTTPEP